MESSEILRTILVHSDLFELVKKRKNKKSNNFIKKSIVLDQITVSCLSGLALKVDSA